MGLVQQFLKSFRQEDNLEAGLFQKNDGTVWLRNPDGSATQVTGGGAPLPSGGSAGQLLTKLSSTDGDADWENVSGAFDVPVDMNEGASVTGESRTTEVFRAYASGTDSILDVMFDSGATAEFAAQSAGSQGDSITITLVNPGANHSTTTASTSGNDVTVVLATDSGGNVTALVSDIATAIVDDPDSAALIGLNSFSDGVANALAQTPLDGGQDPLFAWWVAPNGQEAFATTDEPADIEVVAGQRFQYYDAISGAPKLRIKEADVDGTIYKRIAAALTEDATAFAGIAKPEVPAIPTPQDIVDALVTLGLVTQAA